MTFLNGEMKEKVYVKQPYGFEIKGKEKKFYKLWKTLYGLKQAPRVWYSRIDKHFLGLDFEQSERKPTLYIKKYNND